MRKNPIFRLACDERTIRERAIDKLSGSSRRARRARALRSWDADRQGSHDGVPLPSPWAVAEVRWS